MSVNRLVTIRAAAVWGNARPNIARSYVSKSSGLASGSRNAAPLYRDGAPGLPSLVGKRLKSDTAQKYSPMPSLPINTFEDQDCQKRADNARGMGYVVIKSVTNRDRMPFLSFGPMLLRENCQCSTCVHPDTKQRAVDTFSIPTDISVLDAKSDINGVSIKWSDGHESTYPWRWLIPHQQRKFWKKYQKPFAVSGSPRTHETFWPETSTYPEVSYEDVMSKDESVLQWMEQIWKWGFCFVKGVPVDPESTKALIERIAFIRHTHYGGFWDFTADLTFKDTAYTNEFLGAHTDNTYFTDPARLQLFHLLSHTDGEGGASLLVDGYSAARQLLRENRGQYEALVNHKQPWHASGNEDVCIQPSGLHPVFGVHPDLNRVYQIRWNNYDRAAKTDWQAGEQRGWYLAARRYNEILNEMKRQIWTQLEPGTALMFDNWRMLHGRSGFTGKRRMCGGYVNNDDFVSRFRLLKYGREMVLNNLGNTMEAHKGSNPYSIY